MAAGLYTFTIEQGSTVNFRIDYLDSNNSRIDLTNWGARMQIRRSYSDPIIASLSSSLLPDKTGLNMTPYSGSILLPKSSGSIGVYISAVTTSLFTFDEALYDIEIHSGSSDDEYVIRLLEGKIKLKKNITR